MSEFFLTLIELSKHGTIEKRELVGSILSEFMTVFLMT
jgi:hypothetical protein